MREAFLAKIKNSISNDKEKKLYERRIEERRV
jgi:hypothetical protein